MKLDRNSCRKTAYITTPHFNYDSHTLMDGWLVSFFTDIPTKYAKSLTPLVEVL